MVEVAAASSGVDGGADVGVDSGAGMESALWQAVMRMRHPMRKSFFMGSPLMKFDQQYTLLVVCVEMAGIEPASERIDPRKSTSVACR
jgi:hypothetical protein